MSFDDDKFDAVIPVLPRTNGPHTGGANQRQMLRGSSEGFRTTQRFNADGSVTTLRTKNGLEQFDTTPAPQEDPTHDEEVYMETGQATWTFPGELNPTRNAQATWEMIDLDPQGRWMGGTKVAISGRAVTVADLGKQIVPQPTPAEAPAGVLRDKIPSVAIGFKPTTNPVEQSALETTWGAHVVMKKLACGLFPPALFSGKMRIFMQAQYGAPIRKSGFDYQVGIVGSSATLKYKDTTDDTWPIMQFGFWSHFTTGLFCAADYNYYILQLEEAGGSSVMNISVAPLVPSRAGTFILRRLRENALAGAEKYKAETYLLSTMRIDTSKKVAVGSFDPGLCGETSGYALAYGWKFNSDGSKASIVRLNSIGSELTDTLDGVSKEIHVTISRSALFDGNETGKWTISHTASAARNWLDGWGHFNIFTPENETSTTLNLYSLSATWGTVPVYAFSDVPVYGYYDLDNVWIAAKLSRSSPNAGHSYSQSQTGLVISPFLNIDPVVFEATGDNDMRYDNDNNAIKYSTSAATYEFRDAPPGAKLSMDVSVGAWSYHGYRTAGSYYTKEWPQGSDVTQVEFEQCNYMPPFNDGPSLGTPTPAEYTAVTDYISAAGGYWGYFHQYCGDDKYHSNNTWNMTQTRLTVFGNFEDIDRWALVVPSGDCCCIHVTTQSLRYKIPGNANLAAWNTHHHYDTKVKQSEFYGSGAYYVVGPWSLPYTGVHLEKWNAYSGAVSPPQSVTSATQPEINAWSISTSAIGGTPSGSYNSLFNADISNPVPGVSMRFSESSGGRYIGTEGYNSGGIINGFFMGWI